VKREASAGIARAQREGEAAERCGALETKLAGSIPVSRSRDLVSLIETGNLETMAFQQAPIPVQKTEDFEQLKAAIDRVFGTAAVQKFYGQMESKGVGVREFGKIVNSGLLEMVDSTLARSGKTAKELYESLALSDQALMREYYLEKIEQVDAGTRKKYRKVYRYY
jgi:hypothetical protein